jgi:hypothetical protein
MSAFTAGPWTHILNKPQTAFLVLDQGLRLVCNMSWHASDPSNFPLRAESENNARLIAAAPDLLSALRRTEDNLSRLIAAKHHDEVLMTPWRDEVRAAIAKAIGSKT